MADFVKITKSGFIGYGWDGDTGAYVPENKPRTALKYLRSRCEIEDGVTLGDIFNAVEADPTLMELIAYYSWCRAIDEFHEQAKLPRPIPTKKEATEFVKNENGMLVPANEDEEDVIVALLIEPFAEFYSRREKRKILTDVPMSFEGVSMHFSGLGKSGVHYAVSYTPMNELAHIPVKLSTLVRFDKDFEKMLDAEYSPSFLEVLDAIYWDISFMGGPVDNKEFIESLDSMMDEVKNGTAKTKPWKTLELDCGDDEKLEQTVKELYEEVREQGEPGWSK